MPPSTPRPPSVSARAAEARPAGSPKRHLGLALALLVVVVAVLGVDAALPLRGRVSLVLTGVISLLVVPWAYVVLRRDGDDKAADEAPRSSALAVLVASVILVGLFVGAKWVVLREAAGGEPERFTSAYQSYTVGTLLLMLAGLAGRGARAALFVRVVSEHPARLMAMSFGGVGLLGAFLLTLPISLRKTSDASFVDSLFMSFSAVCVTGLGVRNVADTYSLVGQLILCALIEAGGLGIMVLSAAIAMLAGQRFKVRSRAMLAEMVDASSLSSLRRTVAVIVTYTIVIQTAGAAMLYFALRPYPEVAQTAAAGGPLAGAGNLVWASFFHAVSAFCNAGFSVFRDGLVPFQGTPSVLIPVILLITIGGLGFPVLDELTGRVASIVSSRRPARLSLNTRLVLGISAILTLGLTVAYALLEWGASMKAMPWGHRLLSSLFQSVSARTAGFNVVDIGAMRPATLMLTCFAMFIGASPGSTGGGIKTTTLGVLFAAFRAELRAGSPRLLDRALPSTVVRKATGVAFLSANIVATILFVLMLLEDHPPLSLAFEVFSAFSTTGLSTGITPQLSTAGKLLITLTMFFGRIGPLTLALALASREQPRAYNLPEEKVLIG